MNALHVFTPTKGAKFFIGYRITGKKGSEDVFIVGKDTFIVSTAAAALEAALKLLDKGLHMAFHHFFVAAPRLGDEGVINAPNSKLASVR